METNDDFSFDTNIERQCNIDGRQYKPLISRSICKIKNKTTRQNGSGFLIQLEKNDIQFYYLMTCEHVINDQTNENRDRIIEIEILYDYGKKNKTIKLDDKRYFQNFKFLHIDAFIIEILKEEDNIEDKFFLSPNMSKDKEYSQYKNEDIYVIQFPFDILVSSSGKIKDIDPYEYKFSHLASTSRGSSGSPIFLKKDDLVFGIHFGGNREEQENYGNFIWPIINHLKNNLEYKEIRYGKGKYKGELRNDIREGYGEYYYENGEYYKGEWKNDQRHYKGRLYYPNKNLKYQGDFVNDKLEGIGKLFYENGNYYEGGFKKNYHHGDGKIYNKEGQLIKEIYSFYGITLMDYRKKKIIIIIIVFICLIIVSLIIVLFLYLFLKCEIGEKDSCLTCKKMSTSCASCNPEYELIEGKCVTYSIKATYYIYYDNEISLINSTYFKYILKMKIDDKFIEPCVKYSFGKMGFSEVYYYFPKNEIKSFSYMFAGNEYLLNLTINSYIDTNIITDMNNMFSSCYNLMSINASNLNFNNLISIKEIFSYCSRLISVDFSNFNASNLKYMYNMFFDCSSLKYVNLSNFTTKNVENMDGMFSGCSSLTSIDLSTFNTQNLISMNDMFYDCESLESINLSNFDTKKVYYMGSIFYNCKSLTSIDISNFDTKNVIDMYSMFENCELLTSIDLSSFDTQNVEYMSSMFSSCNSLKSIDITNFNTKNVKSISSMFSLCESLTSLNITNFDTKNVVNMDLVFYYCKSLTSIDISNFDTSNVIDMNLMFYHCESLCSLQLSNFNIKRVESMSCMFCGDYNLIFVDISNFIIKGNGITLFSGLPSTGKIILNFNYINKIWGIPYDWTIIDSNAKDD